MKIDIRTLALAASLGLALSARAEPIKVKVVLPPAVDALQAMVHELMQDDDPGLPVRAKLERLEAFRPTPQTAEKLRAAFGTSTLFLFERQPDRAGRSAWRATLPPLRYTSGPDFSVDWETASLDLTLDKTGTLLDSSGAWPRVGATISGAQIAVQGITLSSHQKRGYGGLWFGSSQMRVAGVRVESKAGLPALTMDELRAEARTVEHPGSVDLRYDSRIGAIGMGGERIEDVHFGMHVANVDKKVLAEFKAASERQRGQPGKPAAGQQLEVMQPLLRSFARSAQARGTVIEIDDISARYHGNRATLHGRIAFDKGGSADLGDLKALARRIVARFEIKVPLAIVRDVAGAMAARQAAAQAGNATVAPNPQMGQTVTDLIVGKLVGGGYARVEHDALVSTLEWRDGMLRADGKPLELSVGAAPTPASSTVAAGANLDLPAAPLPPDALRARRVDASCRLPDYPDEVVRANQPLRLVLSYRVDGEGKVRDPAIASPSRFPAWDAAALVALAQCSYVPALQGGKPIEVPMRWTIQREPGTTRP